jgi:alkylation response protein AidB-like acyl-CoA dehydrogenase
MDFTLNTRQKLMKESFHDFLDGECTKDYVRKMEEDEKGYSAELWHRMAELGWIGLMFPKKYGGIQGSFLELALLFEEIGYFCLPGPFFSTVVLGSLPILNLGNEVQKQEFLPRIAKGELIVTLALTETSATYEAGGIMVRAASKQDDTYTISGTKLFVPDVHVADYVICAFRTKMCAVPEGGISLFLIEAKRPGINHTRLKTIADDKQFEVTFNNVVVSRKDLLAGLHQGWEGVRQILEQAVIAKCAEMIGGAHWVLNATVKYAKERVQFGYPIGSFQAIQHKCADMLVDLESARFVTYEATWKLSKELPCALEASIAKAWVSEAYRRICTEGHQIHGGIGVIKDYDMQLYSRRAKAAEIIFGDSDFHRELVAQRLGL